MTGGVGAAVNAAVAEQWLKQWVMGGGLIDTIILITLLEIAALLAFHYKTKRGLAPRDYLLNAASGLCLMLALRCSLMGSSWYFIPLFLMAAGLAHVADLATRFKPRGKIS